jgi:dUTP pyrophosphatase
MRSPCRFHARSERIGLTIRNQTNTTTAATAPTAVITLPMAGSATMKLGRVERGERATVRRIAYLAPTLEAAMDPMIDVPVEVMPHAKDLALPAYATDGAAGMDLVAAVVEPVVIAPGARVLVPTGLKIAVPAGFEAQVRPRSGFALKQGLIVPNSPGTIDSDYRGELQVILMNLGAEPVRIERGTRIAQLVFAPVIRARWSPAASLPPTDRGSGGFGHTGTATRPN